MTYITSHAALQEPELLNLDDGVVSVAEECAFMRCLDKRLTFSELRAQICLDYDFGCVDAQTTINRLYDEGFISSADDLAFLICAGVKALQEGTV